jgi:hypothetical protein
MEMWSTRRSGAAESKDKARTSFLKKRSKRLLILRQAHLSGHGLDPSTCADSKVFWFFSSEKNIL